MIIETKYRSLAKAITWRIIATLTTVTLVFIIFGKLELAAAVGGLEVILKLLFNFLHERAWLYIKFGRKKVEPFVLWLTGLPVSGKTTIFDFYSEFCGPCRKISPRLKRLDELNDDIVVVKIDINRKNVQGIEQKGHRQNPLSPR